MKPLLKESPMEPFSKERIASEQYTELRVRQISRMSSTSHRRMPENDISEKCQSFILDYIFPLDFEGNRIAQFALYYNLNTELEDRVFSDWKKAFASRAACWVTFYLFIAFYWTTTNTNSLKLYYDIRIYWVVFVWEINDRMILGFFHSADVSITVIGKS